MASNNDLGKALFTLAGALGDGLTKQQTSEGQKPGDTKEINGKTYQWCGKDQKWEPLD